MNKKIMAIIGAALVAGFAVTANAGLSVQWGFLWGMYPSGAGDLTSTSTGDGVAGSSAVLWQLVYSADAAANIVDSSGAATLDDVVLTSRTTLAGGSGGFDEFLYDGGIVAAAFETAAYSTGYVYVRVFQDTNPGAGDKYYNSPTLAISNINLADPLRVPDKLDGNTNSGSQGDSLNLTIVPEPGTFAFLGIGGLLLAVRRMRRS